MPIWLLPFRSVFLVLLLKLLRCSLVLALAAAKLINPYIRDDALDPRIQLSRASERWTAMIMFDDQRSSV